jgi:hypothetical protein
VPICKPSTFNILHYNNSDWQRTPLSDLNQTSELG